MYVCCYKELDGAHAGHEMSESHRYSGAHVARSLLEALPRVMTVTFLSREMARLWDLREQARRHFSAETLLLLRPGDSWTWTQARGKILVLQAVPRKKAGNTLHVSVRPSEGMPREVESWLREVLK